MIKIAITNEKGGTGKSTIACLLVEYLNHLNKKVQLIDTDPIQTSQTWANNCQQEGRQVSTYPATYQIIDTAGSSGSALSWLAQTDLILVPFRPHYADLQTTITWFTSLKPDWQAKITFIPNHWQNTKEQRQGLDHLKEIIEEEKQGQLANPLTNRPALYGTLLNGSKNNFFTRKGLPSEIKEIFKEILTNYRKPTRSPKKNNNLAQQSFKVRFTGIQTKISFRCDTFLMDKIKNTLTSQHLAGNYQFPNLSYFFRSALCAYQCGMALTYQRELNNPRKEVSFRLTEELMTFYNALPLGSRAEVMERALGSYYYQSLG